MADRAARLNTLTGLRFVAAGMIVVGHSLGPFGVPGGDRCPVVFCQAVCFFFVLSGFILTHVYPRLDTAGDRGRFLLARFARIWPAHALGLLLVVLLFVPVTAPLGGCMPGVAALLNLGLVHAWVPIGSLVASFNGPSWSISTELAFYICFLFLIRRWEHTWALKLLLTVLLSGGVLAVCNRARLPVVEEGGALITASGFYTHPLLRLFEFTLGMATALLWRKLSPKLRFGPATGTLLELAAVALAAAAMYPPAWWGVIHRFVTPSIYGEVWLSTAGICVLPFALLIFVMANEWGWVSRLFGSRPAVLLGEISYTVYILHFILIRYYQAHVKAFARWSVWLVYGGYWLLLLVLCHFVWAALERPVRLWLVGQWPKPGPGGVRPEPVRSAGAARPFWQRLADPGRRLLAGEAVVLAGLLAGVSYVARPPSSFLDARTAEALAARSEPTVRGARFGDRFILRAAVVVPTADGIRLRFVWESCQVQAANQFIAVHLVDPTGKILHGADYVRKLREATVRAGAVWEENVDLPQTLLAGVTHIGICITPDARANPMPVAGGPSDWNGRRLLLALPAGPVPKPGTPAGSSTARPT
jgi:peptidoglycan/LPS O-acetylase OafA/YrhL